MGSGPFQLASPEEGAALPFPAFTWHEPVEFVVIAWSKGLATNHYEDARIDWTRIPCSVELWNRELAGIDDKGPRYPSTLQYLGKLSPGGTAMEAGAKAVEGPLAGWLSQVRGSPSELAKLARAVDPRAEAPKDSYHLYAAHFRLSYFTPHNQQVDSLRPFGEVLVHSHQGARPFYRIVLRNFAAVSGANLSQETLEAPLSTSWTSLAKVAQPEYEFHFPAPSELGTPPWSGLSGETVRRWIEDEATHRAARASLLEPSSS